MWLQQRDVDLDQISRDMDFSLYGIEEDDLVEGVTQFKYLGIPLDQSDNKRHSIFRNISRAQKVWGRMGNILRLEGADTLVLAVLYWVVVQAVLFFGT